MYRITPPEYPSVLNEEECRYTSKRIEGFAGLQVRNGPYGAVSSEERSGGLTHFRCEEHIETDAFLESVKWIEQNAKQILDNALESFVDYYEEMKGIIHDDYDVEDARKLAPDIESFHDLKNLCGISSVFILDTFDHKAPVFGIEFGCTWEVEHGAGVQFDGLNAVKSGGADVAFCYYRKD